MCGRGVCVGDAGAQSTTYAYTRVDSPAVLLDLQMVGLLELSKLSVCARVQHAEARRKVRPKSKNLQGKEAALTHKRSHRAREYSTMTGLVALSCGPV